LNPRFPEAYNNLANFHREVGDLGAAADAYAQALTLLPDSGEILALTLLPDSGEILVNLASTNAYLCEWRGRAAAIKQLVARTKAELKGNAGGVLSLSPFYGNALGVAPELLRKSVKPSEAALVHALLLLLLLLLLLRVSLSPFYGNAKVSHPTYSAGSPPSSSAIKSRHLVD
ncbi:hypothetical protein T484DRAFT_1794684, partial [Baffinella frigidus]